MSLKCFIGLHDWNNDCAECSTCGKTRPTTHAWRGCKCTKCSTTRDEFHSWEDYTCVQCGMTLSPAQQLSRFHKAAGSLNSLENKESEIFREVEALLKANPDLVFSKGEFDYTALHHAAEYGRKAMVELLLANKAEVDAKDHRGRTPLHHAVEYGYKAVVEVLLANKAEVNAKDSCGRTPLFEAVRKEDNKAVAEVLLANHADANAKDKDGKTPLSCTPYKDMVKLLLANKAEFTIYDAARFGDLTRLTELLKAAPTLVFSKDDKGQTPLHHAAAIGHKAVVEVLLANKAEVNGKDSSGQTPLHHAASEAVVKVLLANKAEVNAKDSSGQTPLHHAAEHDSEAVVKVLLANKAEVNAKDSCGRTPLSATVSTAYMKNRIVIICEGCGTAYTIGKDAICITSREMANLIGPAAFNMGVNIMIARASAGVEYKELQNASEDILRLGPKGWTCKECHKDNQWRPGNNTTELLRQYGGHE